MTLRALVMSVVLASSWGSAQVPTTAISPKADPQEADLLYVPPELREFVIKQTLPYQGYRMKTAALVRGLFMKPEDGGLGIVYDNDRTRTVAEVWKDRKANCLSLTALYVAACRAIQVDVKFADSIGINRWVRNGDLVYHERHVVAVIPINPVESMVADFNNQPSTGTHRLVFLSEARFESLYHSNRAVELLRGGDMEAANRQAQLSLQADDGSAISWNTSGVVAQAMGNMGKAEKAYLKSLEVDPKDGVACGNLEQLYRTEGKKEQADQYRALGLKLRDGDPYFHAFMAKEFLDSGNVGDALSQINRALKLQRMDPDFYLILAQAELDRGERGAAEKAVQKAIRWSLPEQRKRMESKLELIQSQT